MSLISLIPLGLAPMHGDTPIKHCPIPLTFNTPHDMHETIDQIHASIHKGNGTEFTHVYHALHIPGGHFYIRVENILFLVHKYFFERDSHCWQQLAHNFTLEQKILPGILPELPFIIPNISAKDFASFLWVIYNPKYGVFTATKEEWDRILRVANFLDVPNVIELAEFKWYILDGKNQDRKSVV